MKNILVTAIGSYSVAEVVRSLKQCTEIGKVIGCDIYPKDWHYISQYFEKVLLAPLPVDNEEYLAFMQGIIKRENIDIIIPSTDPEVDFFNENRKNFNDVILTIGSREFIEIARNKYKIQVFLKENNFQYLDFYGLSELNHAPYPIIAKPINGRSSEGVEYLSRFSDLRPDKDYSNYTFQKFVKGNVCTIDIVRNNESKEIVLIPREELLRTKRGLGLTVEVFHDAKLLELARSISERLSAHGAFNMEFIRSSEGDYLIDINPRFSAGIGFTYKIGYDIVKNTLNVFTNKPLEKIKQYKRMILQKHMIEVVNKIFDESDIVGEKQAR